MELHFPLGTKHSALLQLQLLRSPPAVALLLLTGPSQSLPVHPLMTNGMGTSLLKCSFNFSLLFSRPLKDGGCRWFRSRVATAQ